MRLKHVLKKWEGERRLVVFSPDAIGWVGYTRYTYELTDTLINTRQRIMGIITEEHAPFCTIIYPEVLHEKTA